MGIAAVLGRDSGQPVSKGKAIRVAKKAPLFRSMSHAVLSALLDDCTQTIYDTNAVIIRQGERDETVYLVLAGRVRVFYSSPDNDTEVSVAELGSGEIFGELAVLETQPRSATVQALERTNCLRVPGTLFLTALKQSTIS